MCHTDGDANQQANTRASNPQHTLSCWCNYKKKKRSVWHVEYRKIRIFVLYYCFNRQVAEKETFLDFTGHSYSNRLYYLVSQAHVHGGGVVARVREYSLVSASPPQGQESGLISARHQTSLSLHTHSGREVRLGSRSKPVNLIQMWDVTVMCSPQTCNPLQARGAGEEDVPPMEELQKLSDNNSSDTCGVKAPLKHTTLFKKRF